MTVTASVLEEIVVTAQKRSQNLQNIPISVTALTGSAMEHAKIQSVLDLSQNVPGLSVSSTGPGQSEVIIRGMSSKNGTAPTVGYYIDETPISSSARNLDVMLFDLDRVEVLRGPQGTLYGASSMGGTVRYITKRPNLSQVEGRLESTVSQVDGSSGVGYEVNAVLNVPLVEDKLGMRVLAYQHDDKGYIDRYAIDPFDVTAIDPSVPVDRDVNSSSEYGVRAVFEWAPTENLTITPSVMYSKLELDAPYLIDLPPGSIDDERLIQTRLTREDRVDESTIANLTVNWELENFVLTSSTSYFNRKTPGYEDYSKVATFLIGLPIVVPWEQLDDGETEDYIQEFRIAGETGSLNYVAGLYYNKSRAHSPDVNPYSAEFTEVYGDPLDVFGFEVAYSGDPRTKSEEMAIFAELTYNFTEALAVTVGARVFEYDVERTDTEDGLFNGGLSTSEDEFSANDWTPKVSVSYQLNDDTLLYATAAEGYRSGASVGSVPESVCAPFLAELGLSSSPTSVESDSAWSYELGGKMELMDQRMRINASIYHIDWTDYQQAVLLQCGFGFLANTGDAESKGAELEWSFAVTDALLLSANVGYTDAELTSTVASAPGEVGDPLLSVPEWEYSAAVDYSRAITSQWNGFARLSYYYVDEVARSYDLDSPFRFRPSYEQVNLQMGVNSSNDNWRVTLFARNLLNEVAESGVYDSNTAADLPFTRAVAIIQPRTVGLTVGYNFN